MGNKNKKQKIVLLVLFLVLAFAMLFFAVSSLKYQLMYEEAIKQGAEGIVLALEMSVACQSLGNFTTEEIKDKWIDMFLITKIRGNN